jgi:hypothetical protein
MSSQDRLYQLQFKDRPVIKGDIGSLLKIGGLIVNGSGVEAHMYLSGYTRAEKAVGMTLSDEEWSDFIRRSDDHEILIGNAKIFQRKVRWEASSAVKQKAWVADRFQCIYRGAVMGKALMTVDHFEPLEMGGKNDEANYLMDCKKCNEDKANLGSQVWRDKRGLKNRMVCGVS